MHEVLVRYTEQLPSLLRHTELHSTTICPDRDTHPAQVAGALDASAQAHKGACVEPQFLAPMQSIDTP